jgi:hypothetical protein
VSKRYLQQLSERIRDRAGRAYIEQRNGQRQRVERRESDEEVRQAVRGWLAAEGGY